MEKELRMIAKLYCQWAVRGWEGKEEKLVSKIFKVLDNSDYFMNIFKEEWECFKTTNLRSKKFREEVLTPKKEAQIKEDNNYEKGEESDIELIFNLYLTPDMTIRDFIEILKRKEKNKEKAIK